MSNPNNLVNEHYKGKHILVTGGASFIGSTLVESLLSNGASVTVADNLSSGSMENLEEVRNDIEFMEGDLRRKEFAYRASRGKELVFHLAANHGGRGYIDTHPVECLNNILLDHIVFDAAASSGAAKIIYASSACVYPTVLQEDTDQGYLLKESDVDLKATGRGFPDGEYGWAKLTGELQLAAFHKQHRIDGVACRLFTAYGERENESHSVIALIAKALSRLDPYPVWGDGQQTRNFTYVGDTVEGMILAAARLDGFKAINIGSARHFPINELIAEIFDQLDWRPAEIEYQRNMPVGVRSRAADNTLARKLLDWSPRTSLKEGIGNTLSWYRTIATPERLSELDARLTQREY